MAIKSSEQVYMAKTSSWKISSFKRNKDWKSSKKSKKTDNTLKKGKDVAGNKEKHAKRDKPKLKCYYYGIWVTSVMSAKAEECMVVNL